MVLYGASDIFADGTEIVRSRFPQAIQVTLQGFWSRALASEPVRLCRCARRIIRTRTRLSRAARSSGDRLSAQIGPVMRAAFGARRIAVSVPNGGSARLLGDAIRLRRAMTATWAAGVISRRCAPVTRRSRPRDRGAAGAGFGSVSAAARTVR